MFYDVDGRLRSMMASWTDVPEKDLFTRASAGRSHFRSDDLLRLCALVREIMGRQRVK